MRSSLLSPENLHEIWLGTTVIEHAIDGVNWSDLALHSGMTAEEAKHRAVKIDAAFTNQMSGISVSIGVHDLNYALL